MQTGIPKEKLGECKMLGKYPHLFSTPIFFADPRNQKIHNGTLTLLRIDGNLIGVTCWHVIEPYLKRKEEGENLTFYLGSNTVNPEAILIDHDAELDLATLRLNEHMLPRFKGTSFPEIGSQQITNIYQAEVKKGDIVIFGGLPGRWVQQPSRGRVQFETFSVGRCPVYSAGTYKYACEIIDPNSWPTQQEEHYVAPPAKNLYHMGGLSGCPAFVETVSDKYEFAGIVYEGVFPMGGTTLVFFIRPARLIKSDGTIQRDFAARCNSMQQEGAGAIEGMLEEVGLDEHN